ncbi:exodeoxyribonuclease V subunit alpha [Alteromonadales bacterium alter-6D02]|nr:exodeoxyribonuclease V subunit alpha [Alteromonadales bacterium alter-6D02]
MQQPSIILTILSKLVADNKIRALDYQFARFIAQHDANPWVLLASALTSYQSGLGHVCVDTSRLSRQPIFGLLDREVALYFADFPLASNWPQQLLEQLSASAVQGTNAPLTVVKQRIYLQRYWQFEQQICAFLTQRAVHFNPQAIRPLLESLFKPSNDIDWQQVAVAIASAQQFSVISGGPGTGKTTTVTKLLALLVQMHQQQRQQQNQQQSQHQSQDKGLKIELVAPTGKAAARLTESISGAIDKLDVDDDIKALIPSAASTIHRLLGVIPKRTAFKHNQDNPLHVDVLIVDEASMIDISLMAALFCAIAPHTKVILLGDKDQLASVEAGAVFADICQGLVNGQPNYDQAMRQWLAEQTSFAIEQNTSAQQTTPLSNSLALLQKSYRFDANSGIGALAKAVNHSDIGALQSVWQQGFNDIELYPLNEQSPQAIVQMAVNGYEDYLRAAKTVQTEQDVEQVLALFNQFQLLTPLRGGQYGLEQLNQRIEQRLKNFNLIDSRQGVWYIGRPVMISSNDHAQQLFNGDIGIVLPDIDTPVGEPNKGRVYFKMADGNIKSFLPSRLPSHDTVYAMTIHKSQGSEFDHVLMALPEQWSGLLTKELIYTGITRAKKRVDLFTPLAVLTKATRSQTVRDSGLADALYL